MNTGAESLPAGLSCWAKTALKEFRGNWARPALANLPEWIDRISESDFRTGKSAVYIGTSFKDSSGNDYIWMVMDVEAAGRHHDIHANIEAGKSLLAFLCDENLTELLVILLTGCSTSFERPWPTRKPLFLKANASPTAGAPPIIRSLIF